MIHLSYQTCGKSYLVAVAGVARSRSLCDNSLREFAFESSRYILRGVAASRNSHSLIYVCSARKRVSYRAAETSCRTAERLDFRRMVVSFVFEHNQPLLRLAVYVYVNLYRTSVDFVAHVEIVEFALFFEFLDGNGSYIHKTGIFVLSLGIELLV